MTWSRTTLRTLALVVLTVVVALLFVRLDGAQDPGEPAPAPTSREDGAPSGVVEPRADPGVDPDSGLAWVLLDDLPADAQGVVEDIEDGGPFACEKDGSTFGNYEGILPARERGHYAEYTVIVDCSGNRGARRIVAGDDGELYYTADHYASFDKVLVEGR